MMIRIIALLLLVQVAVQIEVPIKESDEYRLAHFEQGPYFIREFNSNRTIDFCSIGGVQFFPFCGDENEWMHLSFQDGYYSIWSNPWSPNGFNQAVYLTTNTTQTGALVFGPRDQHAFRFLQHKKSNLYIMQLRNGRYITAKWIFQEGKDQKVLVQHYNEAILLQVEKVNTNQTSTIIH